MRSVIEEASKSLNERTENALAELFEIAPELMAPWVVRNRTARPAFREMIDTLQWRDM